MSMVIQYNDSHEMTEHIVKMESLNWKASSVAYGKLRVRYKMHIKEGEHC